MNAPSQASLADDQIAHRLRRIKGQLDGVIGMYEDERACVDIVRQVIAVSNSLKSVARELLTTEASRCNRERKVADLDAILREMFKY